MKGVKRIWERLTATSADRAALAVGALVVLVLIPFAGNYGAWDPWESHYGEVARQMLARNDFISLWWPGSPLDHPPRGEFWSKPVLTFWLEALSLKLAGIEWSGARPDELVTSWRPEWALRMPSLLLSMAAIAAVYTTLRRLVSRRTAALAAVVLLTSPEWLLISRQAMTDMPFVAPMTIALCLAALALLDRPEVVEAELPRRQWGRLSWPHARAFYGFVALFIATTLPQLIVMSVQLHWARIPALRLLVPGAVFPMSLYVLCFLAGLWWSMAARTRRELLLLSAWVLCAVASLAKGPAGLALPAITILLYVVVAGRWRDLLRLELLRGPLVLVACGLPWWSAMDVRHGRPFWNELIGDNYVNRAAGRHGDRGTFEYYLQWIGYGMFPWSGITAVASLAALLKPKSVRGALARFAFVWVIVDVATITLVNTKFHHYSLPALPALAILTALFLDELLTEPRRWQAIALTLIALPITFVCARDLAAFPARFLWMFDYDYVLIPNVGRPWPLPSLYGERYEYGGLLTLLGSVGLAAVVALVVAAWRGWRVEAVEAVDAATPPPRGRIALVAAGVVAALVIGIAVGPSTSGPAPEPSLWHWLIPTAFMLGALALVALTTRAGLVWLVAAAGVVYGGFLIDRYLPDLGPHWSEKHVVAAYYKNRSGPQDPLIVWNLYWRGENFYTRNEVYSQATPAEKWAWVEPGNLAPQAWFAQHKGTRVFFLVERTKLESLRGALPAESRNLRTVDDSNNKLLLVETRI
jgi:4-amino-4-deoxy-L-arabinose transferase-like glycosyltransferase